MIHIKYKQAVFSIAHIISVNMKCCKCLFQTGRLTICHSHLHLFIQAGVTYYVQLHFTIYSYGYANQMSPISPGYREEVPSSPFLTVICSLDMPLHFFEARLLQTLIIVIPVCRELSIPVTCLALHKFLFLCKVIKSHIFNQLKRRRYSIQLYFLYVLPYNFFTHQDFLSYPQYCIFN